MLNHSLRDRAQKLNETYSKYKKESEKREKQFKEQVSLKLKEKKKIKSQSHLKEEFLKITELF